MSSGLRVTLIGYGEVGQILASDLRVVGLQGIRAWDIAFTDTQSVPSRALAARVVRPCVNAREAVADAQVVISAVTAAQSFEAAQAVAPALATGAYFVDLNSVSPEVKRRTAALIDSHGGRFVEAAVMAPVPPQRLGTPILLGGSHAEAFLPIARKLHFDGARMFDTELGRASAAKMCRSVIVKGMESLLTESLLTARYFGVESSVLASLQDVFSKHDWERQAHYMISRSLLHGRRRAEEMREVARTVSEAGIDPWMSAACARRQDWSAAYRTEAAHGALEELLDAMLTSIRRSGDSIE
jgi:3-hydroxyisobutyrate dehydrogenase-like beta-hydroxyacid dehydrogenase